MPSSRVSKISLTYALCKRGHAVTLAYIERDDLIREAAGTLTRLEIAHAVGLSKPRIDQILRGENATTG